MRQHSTPEGGDPDADTADLARRLVAEYESSLPVTEIVTAIMDARDGYQYLGMDADDSFERLARRELDLRIEALSRSGAQEPRDPGFDE